MKRIVVYMNECLLCNLFYFVPTTLLHENLLFALCAIYTSFCAKLSEICWQVKYLEVLCYFSFFLFLVLPCFCWRILFLRAKVHHIVMHSVISWSIYLTWHLKVKMNLHKSWINSLCVVVFFFFEAKLIHWNIYEIFQQSAYNVGLKV